MTSSSRALGAWPVLLSVMALGAFLESSASAAPQPLINYFQPMPIVGKLSTTVWGAATVGARDPGNGLEDGGANGGVGPQQEAYFYWDGKILKGGDGKYHMYASHWNHNIGFGPPSGGSTGWQTSIPMEAVSDDLMGPYVSQGNCYTKNQQGNDMGHNVTAVAAPVGANPYILSVGEIVPGQMFGAGSADGPWTLLGLVMTDNNGHNGCGTLSSNFTLAVGGDGRFWATSRSGCVMDSDQVLGTYKVETDSVLPNLEKNDNANAEDEVIWYSGGYYHIVYNYWNVQRAYHIMSKDGLHDWMNTGLAYQAVQSPANASSKWLRYTDGTVNQWHNMERPGVYQENGHVTAFTFAVTDVDKNASVVNSGGSKVLVVPFNGVQFDCDNGDAASCAEASGGATGNGGAGAGGRGGVTGIGGGGAGGMPAKGSGGAPATGGAGGSTSSGGAAGSGSISASGGQPDAGASGTGGTGGSTKGDGTGGNASVGTGGKSNPGTGGFAAGTGGSSVDGGGGRIATPGSGGSANRSESGSGGGCACSVGSADEGHSSAALLLLAVVIRAIHRRRRAYSHHLLRVGQRCD